MYNNLSDLKKHNTTDLRILLTKQALGFSPLVYFWKFVLQI